MRCSIHCPPAARVPVAAASGVFCAAALAVYWLTGAWPLVLAAAAVLAAVTAAAGWGLAGVSRRLSRLALRSPNTVAVVVRRGGLPAPRWPDRPALGALPLVVETEVVRAPYQIEAPPLAIEGRVLTGGPRPRPRARAAAAALERRGDRAPGRTCDQG